MASDKALVSNEYMNDDSVTEHLTNKKCESDNCMRRHPNSCKLDESIFGCKRAECLFLHQSLATYDEKTSSYQFAGC